MANCPTCHQKVKPDAVICPFCRTELKAHGHQGIELHRATGLEPLCKTCIYDADNSCTYPKRPDARECTMYVSSSPLVKTVGTAPANYRTGGLSAEAWLRRNGVWVGLSGLIIVSLLMALSRR